MSDSIKRQGKKRIKYSTVKVLYLTYDLSKLNWLTNAPNFPYNAIGHHVCMVVTGFFLLILLHCIREK